MRCLSGTLSEVPLFSRGNQKNIKHLVVDEMQDYSYLQYRICS